jgi:hypothetical protein
LVSAAFALPLSLGTVHSVTDGAVDAGAATVNEAEVVLSAGVASARADVAVMPTVGLPAAVPRTTR